jgi:hypothetical protein
MSPEPSIEGGQSGMGVRVEVGEGVGVEDGVGVVVGVSVGVLVGVGVSIGVGGGGRITSVAGDCSTASSLSAKNALAVIV